MEAYIDYLGRLGKNGAVKQYGSLLRGFRRWLGIRDRDICDFTPNDVEEYMRVQNMPSTANAFLAAIRGYAKYRAGSLPFGDPTIMAETQRMAQLNLVANLRVHKSYDKIALTPNELKSLISRMHRDGEDDLWIAATYVHFYFGARPIELALYMKDAKINWNERDMVITTAKTFVPRFLPWHDSLTPYLELWYEGVPYKQPSDKFTKHMKKWIAGGIRVEAKTARQTFITQMRLAGIDDFHTSTLVGHTTRSSPVGDIYTDFTMMKDVLRDIMENKHYMIASNIL